MPVTPVLVESTKLGNRFRLLQKQDTDSLVRELIDYIQALEMRLKEYDDLHANHESRLTAGGL